MMNMDELTRKAEQNIRQALADYDKVTRQHTVLEDVTDDFITTLAYDSVRAKQGLWELFSKSPVWDEELQALVINGTRTHNPDPDRIYQLGRNILQLNGHPWDYQLNDILQLFWDKNPKQYELDRSTAAVEAIAPGAYVPGKKLSRVFKQICVALGVADETAGSTFQRLYAQFADELTARKIDFKLYVSINPAHFLTMSNPKGDIRGCTLTSCHSFNSTDYSYNCGCSGYARDETSFIVFTVDDPHNPESFHNRKTTRQIFAYRPGSGLLLQSRMYNTSGGTRGASEDSTLYRDLIQREISELENQPNLWKTHASYGDYSDFVHVGAGFGGYTDWIYDDFDGHISFRADCDMDSVRPLVVGTYGLCVVCGEEISDGMYCSDCNNERETCDDCGGHCSETFFVYDPRGQERYVCEYCLNDHYTRCARCGDYHHNDTMTYVEDADEDYCDECLPRVAERCDECGEWHLCDNMYRAYGRYGDEVWVCEDCLDHFVACDECGELYHRRNINEVTAEDGTTIHLCDSCMERKEREAV